MTKHVISHENNTFDISTTPFLDNWKSTVLAQAKLLGISIDHATSIGYQELSSTIEAALLQRSGTVKQLKYIVHSDYNDSSTVLTAQEQLYLKKAAFYGIELNEDEWCELTDLHMFDAVDSWEKKLKEALYLGVNWRMNDYDPDGLELAIEQQEELCDTHSSLERRQANAYYYSTRGV